MTCELLPAESIRNPSEKALNRITSLLVWRLFSACRCSESTVDCAHNHIELAEQGDSLTLRAELLKQAELYATLQTSSG